MANNKNKNPYLDNNFYNIYTPSSNSNQQEWETSNFATPDPYANFYSNQQPQQQQFSQQPVYYPPDPYNPYGNFNSYPNTNVNEQSNFQSQIPNFNPNVINNQFVAAGAQFFQNQMTNYSQDLVNKGKSWFDNRLKYYFAVDTVYVFKKLLLLFFPYFQKNFSSKYNSNEPIAPRDDLNVPDLYIPSMAFVTYILLAGYVYGLKNVFTPEKLGMQASFAIFWLVLEIAFSLLILYLMGIKSNLGFFHLASFCGYKFVFMILLLLFYSIYNHSYYYVLCYSSLSLAYFLIRTLNTAIQTNPNATSQYNSTKSCLYVVLALAAIQPFILYWITSKVVFHEEVKIN